MGRTPVKLKEVIYGISSNKVEIMGSLGRDALSAISKKIGGGWFDVTVFGIAPTVGTVMYELDLFCCFLFSSFVVFCCFRWDVVGFSLSRPLFKRSARRRGKQRRERERRKNPRDHHHHGVTLLSNHKTGTRWTTKNKRNSTTDSKQKEIEGAAVYIINLVGRRSCRFPFAYKQQREENRMLWNLAVVVKAFQYERVNVYLRNAINARYEYV